MNNKIVSVCNYCKRGLTDYCLFYSACVQCNEAIKGACNSCFNTWRNSHPTRPQNMSVNKWNGMSHLVDNYSDDYFDQYVGQYHCKILTTIH